jgi:hypothetical protein
MEGTRGTDWTMMQMNADERVAFDLFLVRMKDQLAYEPGTFEHRFRSRVKAMATGLPVNAVLADTREEFDATLDEAEALDTKGLMTMRLADIERDYDVGVAFYLPEDEMPDDVREALVDALFEFVEKE